MLFAFFYFISFKYVQQVEENISDLILPISFLFQNGGNYSISIKSERNDRYFFLIASVEDINKYWIGKDKSNICDDITSAENLYLIQSHKRKANFSGIIKNEGFYTINFKKCNNFSSKEEIEVIFMNPNSCLSFDDQILLKNYQYVLFTTILFYSLWIMNWYQHFSINNFLHLLLTILFLLKIVSLCLYFCELQIRNKTDEEHQIFLAEKYLYDITDFVCLFVTILIICFYDILTRNHKIITLFLSVILSSLTLISMIEFLVFCILYIIMFNIFLYKIYSKISEKDGKKYFLIYATSIINLYFFFKRRLMNKISLHERFQMDILDVVFYILYGLIFRMKEDTSRCYFRIAYFKDYSSPEITFPSDVTEIVDYAFMENKSTKKVDFESNSKLRKIGKCSFSHSSIESISIPSSVTKIGELAFFYCELNSIKFPKNSKLEIIEENAFGFSKIKEICIPSSVSKIGREAFCFCKNLKKVTFSDSSKLRIFEKYLFNNCSIEELTIPGNIETFKKYWCMSTLNLNKVIISPNNKNFKFYDDKFIIGKSDISTDDFDVIIFAPRNVTNVVIPSFIKKIASCAFYNCFNLKKVEFSNDSQLQIIDSYAFGLTRIESITIPSKVTRIGTKSFGYCSFLKKIEFSKNSELEIIKKFAFEHSRMTSFIIGCHVKQIGSQAFSYCSQLKLVEIEGNSKLTSINKDIFSYSNCTIIMIPSSLHLTFK